MILNELDEKVQSAIDTLKSKSHISKLAIGLSGGKDSLCLCELIKMADITNVCYFNMEFLPNLRIQKELLAYPIVRFNIPEDSIIKVPSEHFINCMNTCSYTWYSERAKELFPKIKRSDVFQKVSRDNKATIVVGTKRVDSRVSRLMIDQNRSMCLYPIKDWTLIDVLAFMKLRNIQIPKLTKQGCRGVGLDEDDIRFIYDNYYDDFLKIEKVFPFVRAMILKYEYFDVHKKMRIV